jgi:Dolichyl-phosphate-mannose-protein mannosyltransferase
VTLSVVFASLLSLSTGLVLVSLCWPALRPIKSNFCLKFFLALGIGCGISSALFFLCLFAENSDRHLALIEVLLLGTLLAILWMSISKAKEPVSDGPFGDHSGGPVLGWKIRWASFLAFVVALASSSYAFIALILRGPNGEWDAFGIWNLRARFLFRAGVQWRDSFSRFLPWSHTDYPLLIPASVARLWKYSGHDSVAVPILLALIFTYATVGLTVSAVAALRTSTQGLLAGLVLVSTPYFVQLGASEYADVPLGFFYLATFVLICMPDRGSQGRSRLLMLAGITAGFASWTKNEGLLFLASILAAHAVVVVQKRGGTSYLRQVIPFVTGFAPILVIIVFFKRNFGGPSDVFSAPLGIVHQLFDIHRYFQVSRALLRQVFDFGGWVITPMAVLAFYLLALGSDIDPEDRVNWLTAALALVMTLAGYCIICDRTQ